MAAGASLGEAEAGGSAGTALAVFGARIAAGVRAVLAGVPMPRPMGGEEDGVLSAVFLLVPARRRPGLPIPVFAR